MKVLDTHSDDELLRCALAGDEEAFTTLYRRRQAGVFRFALHMCGSPAAAEDVTQDVFLALLREGHGYSPERGSLAAFLCGMARNYALRRLRLERRSLPMPEQAGFAAAEDISGEAIRAQEIERVRKAVLALPAPYREVIALCELEELDYAQAAEYLGCAIGTVRSRLHRARWLLMDRLGLTRKVRCLK